MVGECVTMTQLTVMTPIVPGVATVPVMVSWSSGK